eukprot:GEMP01019921.1.p1 GENE.GEMP01019921.1~~GEMP01019921.1.p1  ORF type:complete len:324 (+),score=62.01 GEMP01019921.1:768-1739(+)
MTDEGGTGAAQESRNSDVESAIEFFDIAVNLSDDRFRGIYNGKEKHPDDTTAVLQRAADHKVKYMLLTGGSVEDSKEVQDMCVQLDPSSEVLFSTLGVHPTRCNAFKNATNGAVSHLDALFALDHPRVLAWGEMGLDYDRLDFCAKEVQLEYFEMQLAACVARKPERPFFLHLRGDASAYEDFVRIIKPHNVRGVVHSFTGTEADLRTLLDFPSLFIGINGCSLKTDENLKVVSQVPIERMMLETDSPYCDIRPAYAGFKFVQTTFPVVKKPDKFVEGQGIRERNEPCRVRQVAEVVAGVHNVSVEQVASICYRNACRMFLKK